MHEYSDVAFTTAEVVPLRWFASLPAQRPRLELRQSATLWYISQLERLALMPAYEWKKAPMGVIQEYSKRYPTAPIGAPAMWAVWAVDSLHYLDDLDDEVQRHYPAEINGHHADVVDMAHVRWATGTAITALDLCAAAFGELYCGNAQNSKKLDLRSFASNSTRDQVVQHRRSLPSPARNWVDAVEQDQRYKDIHEARNPFTHSWLPRSMSPNAPPGHGDRTGFRIRETEKHVNARELVKLSKSLATDQVTAFLDVIDGL